MVAGGDPYQGLQQVVHLVDLVHVRGGRAGLLPHRAGEHPEAGRHVRVAGAHVHLGDGRREGKQRLGAAGTGLDGPAADLPHDREHGLVAVIVPKDQGEVDLLVGGVPAGDLLDDVHPDDALVHAPGPDLDVPALLDAAVEDVHVEALEDVR